MAIHCLLTAKHLHDDPLPAGNDGLERFGALLSIFTPLSRPASNSVRRGKTMENRHDLPRNSEVLR